jgi:tRNA/rRNA methyltransferase
MDLGKVSVVLHRPNHADNLGAAARAMKNFGLTRLVVVPPESWDGRPRGGCAGTSREEAMARAATLARHASDLLEGAAIHADLRGALADSTWTCGTSSRTVEGRPRLTPRQLAAEVARRSLLGPVALVFGEERRGLSDAELELCQAVCTIPTSPDYDSMNLAQSVAVLCYELACAAGAERSIEPPPPGEPARHATVEALWARLTPLLVRSGYLNPQNPEQILAEWRRLLTRAEPSQREVELLLAAVKQLERELEKP